MSGYGQLNDPVASVLARMSELLMSMKHDMSDVAQLVSSVSGRQGVVLSPTEVIQLQTLDRMCQSLQDLALISETLAAGSSHVPGTTDLQLTETRAILALEQNVGTHPTAGDVELF